MCALLNLLGFSFQMLSQYRVQLRTTRLNRLNLQLIPRLYRLSTKSGPKAASKLAATRVVVTVLGATNCNCVLVESEVMNSPQKSVLTAPSASLSTTYAGILARARLAN